MRKKERNSEKTRSEECENSSVVLDGSRMDDLSGNHTTQDEIELGPCVCLCVYGYVNAVRIMLCKLVNHNKRGSDMFAFNSKLVNEGKAMEIFRQLM